MLVDRIADQPIGNMGRRSQKILQAVSDLLIRQSQQWVFRDLAVRFVTLQHRQRLLEKRLPLPSGRLRFIFRRHVASLDVVNNGLPQFVVVAGYT